MAGLDVNAKLTLDSTNFDANMRKSAETADATGRAAAKAAKDAAAAQAIAARFAGDAVSEQSLRIIAARRAEAAASRDFAQVQAVARKGLLDEATSSNAAAAALQRLVAAKLATAAASEREAISQEHAVVSQRMAASAAVRGLENGNVGIRAVENFITTVPGVGKALQAIFPVIGAAAFVTVLVEMGSKLYDIAQKAKNAGTAIAEAFIEQHERAQVANDDLAIQNDKLDMEIAKLSGKPGNGLALALDESRKMADQLLVSLQADRKELESLLKEHEVGAFGSMLSGVASTGRQSSELLSDQADLTKAVRAADEQYRADVAKDPNAVAAATVRRNAAVRKSFQSQIDTYVTESARLRKEQADSERDAEGAANAGEGSVAVSATDNSGKLSNVSGRIEQLRDAMNRELMTESIGQKEAVVNRLKGGAELASATNKAAELKYKAMEAELNREKLLTNVTVKDEYDYWDARRNAFAAGSEQYNDILAKQATLAEQSSRAAHETIKKFQAEQLSDARSQPLELMRIAEDSSKFSREMAKQANDTANIGYDESSRLNVIQVSTAAKLQEQAAQEAAGKTMSKYAVAAQEAAAHTRVYNAELDALIQREKEVAANSFLTTEERARATAQLAEQQASLEGNRQVQLQSDAYKMRVPNGAADALNEFVIAAKDGASEMKQLVSGTLSNLNRTIVEELTSPNRQSRRNLFTDLGRSTATSVASAGLNHLEGMALGALGFGSGKAPKGTATDPLHVIMAGATMPGQSALGGLLQMPGMPNIASGAASGGAGSGFMSFLSGLIPGFATGTDDAPGGPSWVGEKGPELVNLPRGASVVPNDKIGSMGGDTHNWNIDARGSNDPAQVKMLVQQGIRQAAPQLMAMSVGASREQQRRQPGIRR